MCYRLSFTQCIAWPYHIFIVMKAIAVLVDNQLRYKPKLR